jgi:hypothetical protein
MHILVAPGTKFCHSSSVCSGKETYQLTKGADPGPHLILEAGIFYEALGSEHVLRTKADSGGNVLLGGGEGGQCRTVGCGYKSLRV